MNKENCVITLLALASATAHGQATDRLVAANAATPSVKVSGSRTEQRRLDTAASVVIGHDELLRYGDQNLADALRRVPGITVSGVQGRGGELRLRGLGNGYTQILLDGQAVPTGFSVDTLAPELVERVEVLRVASAELGAQAIAGTINIVLKKRPQPAGHEFKAAVSTNQGRASSNVYAQLNRSLANATYSVAAVLDDGRTSTEPLVDELVLHSTGATHLQRLTQRREAARLPSLNLSPRLSWTLDNGDTLAVQPFLRLMRMDIDGQSRETSTPGRSSQFPNSDSTFAAHAETLRSDVQWIRKLDNGAKWELKFGVSHFQRRSDSRFWAINTTDQRAGERGVHSSATERSVTLAGKLSWPTGSDHAVVTGWDASHGQRSESRLERSSFVDDPIRTSQDRYGATLDRLTLFVQDDWTLSQAWSVASGLRGEFLSTGTQSNVVDNVRQRSSLLSPTIQSLYKLDGAGQLRLALSRTFKAPTLFGLAQRHYTSDNNNSPNNPDSRGNPYLMPERAWGLDMAYERYWGKGALFSASVYARRINDVVTERLLQEGGRWVSTRSNTGRADTWGMEFETKLPLRTVWARAPAMDLRANLARNWSRVVSIAGPDNRLASQTPFSANLGVDHKMEGMPVTLGASFSYQGGGPARLSEHAATWSGAKRELDLFGSWQASASGQWQLALSNLLHQDNLSQARYADQGGTMRMLTQTPTGATIRISYLYKPGK